jgi:hypothetical protein
MSVSKQLFSSLWNLADTDYRYGVYCDYVNAHKYLLTSGSSTTVSELNTGDNVFEGFANGDILSVNVDGAHTRRIITDATLAPDSVVVGSAVDWENGGAGRAFSYAKWLNGTAATDGWFRVADLNAKNVVIEWVTKNATSADVTIEGRVQGSNPITIYTKNYTAVGEDGVNITESWDEIRVGVKLNTDTGTNLFNIFFHGERFGGR